MFKSNFPPIEVSIEGVLLAVEYLSVINKPYPFNSNINISIFIIPFPKPIPHQLFYYNLR